MAETAEQRIRVDAKRVGRLMRKWRNVSGLSLDQVGEKIGTGKANLSMAETGKQWLSLPMFLAFCQAIGAPVSKVLEDRLLSKNRDVDRLAAEIVKHSGARDLEWLAGLSKSEYRAAIKAARDRVDLERLRAGHTPNATGNSR